MAFSVEYFHARVLAEIESWPVDVLADDARIVELLVAHGPNLKLPHSRALGDGVFELRPRGRSGIGRAFYCFLVGKSGCTPCFYQEIAANTRSRNQARSKAIEGDATCLI